MSINKVFPLKGYKRFKWNRHDFFWWGTPRQFKGYQAPPQRVRGRQPPEGREVHIFNQFKIIETESIFQKDPHFSCSLNPLVLRKNFKTWRYFRRISEVFESFFKNFNFLEGSYKYREIFDEFYYLVQRVSRKLENGLDRNELFAIGF